MYGNEAWSRTRVTTQRSPPEYIRSFTASHRRSVDGLRTRDLFSSPSLPSGTYFIVDMIAFYKRPFEWNSVRLRVQQRRTARRGIPLKMPVIVACVTGYGTRARHGVARYVPTMCT